MQKLFRQIKPILSGLPIIGVVFVLSLILAKQIIKYTPTRYLTVAKIKLDTRKYGVSNDMLYKDFDVFTSENKIETEAEILGSHLLIKRALEKVNFNNQIKRIGKIKTTYLYRNSPFSIKTKIKNQEIFDAPFEVVIADSSLFLTNENLKNPIRLNGKLNEWFEVLGNQVKLQTNDAIIKEQLLDLNGKYGFTIHSEEGLINAVRENLNVTAVDKEMTVLRVVFKDEMPQKAADFNNALCEAYIDDYVEVKSYAANKTVEFIDQKLEEVGNDLARAEEELEIYKLENNVVNIRQETETGLRQVADLQVQLVNTMMEEKAIAELESYLDSGSYFDEKAIQVGFGDLLLTELIKKLKNLNDEKRDLLIKYTEESDEVKVVNQKIAEIKHYIQEAIRSNKNNIETRRAQLEADLEMYTHQFDDVPMVERKLQILQREFQLQESVFNFLSQKRIEAFIASTSQTSFHRIIQPAYVPTKPTAPNTTLITFVCGLLGLILGITIVFLRKISDSKILDREDIERNSLLPLSGYIHKSSLVAEQDYQTIVQSLLLKEQLGPKQMISVASTDPGEGKSDVAYFIFKALMAKGYRVCLLDYDLAKAPSPSYDSELNLLSVDMKKLANGDIITTRNDQGELAKAPTLFDQKICQLRKEFDFVVVNASPVSTHIEGVEIMKKSELSLFVFKAGVSQIESVKNINLLTEEYHVPNVHLFLTHVGNSINYSGNHVNQPIVFTQWLKNGIEQLKHQVKIFNK